VTIVAGCGVHTDAEEGSNHNGIHRFFLESGSHVVYKEKHIGIGEGGGKRVIDPVTYAELDDGAVLEMETLQLGGVDETTRDTTAILGKNSSLIIHESIMTDNEETASTKFTVDMEGEDSNVDLISRSVAKGNSFQEYSSVINGKSKCKGHSECDAILVGNGRVNASPALNASSIDANLIHEAAIGKIAGEQIIKLMTLGLTEEEAEERIIAGFLGA
jgi:Fe-S cluster assembly scaffold protein SufB